MPLSAGFALAVSLAFGVNVPVSPVSAPQVQTIQERVEEYFFDNPIMKDISRCESHFRQYNKSGSVYRGVQNNKDVGVMQINERYHLENSKKLELDIYTLDGNLAYARQLYEKEGTTPWASSRACWGKTKNAKLLAITGK